MSTQSLTDDLLLIACGSQPGEMQGLLQRLLRKGSVSREAEPFLSSRCRSPCISPGCEPQAIKSRSSVRLCVLIVSLLCLHSSVRLYSVTPSAPAAFDRA